MPGKEKNGVARKMGDVRREPRRPSAAIDVPRPATSRAWRGALLQSVEQASLGASYFPKKR